MDIMTFELTKEWKKSDHNKYLRCTNALFPIYKLMLTKYLIKDLPKDKKEKIFKDNYVISYTLMTAQWTQHKLFPENEEPMIWTHIWVTYYDYIFQNLGYKFCKKILEDLYTRIKDKKIKSIYIKAREDACRDLADIKKDKPNKMLLLKGLELQLLKYLK